MIQVINIDGTPAGENPGANAELVQHLELMLADAKAGRLVCVAGVFGFIDRGKLSMRFMTHTNNWEIHDRLLARVGALRTMMENDLLAKLQLVEPPLEPPIGDDAA